MSVFIMKDNKLTFNPTALAFPEWNAIWERDSSKDKATAIQELKYVYFMAEQKRSQNPYINYTELERPSKIIKDHITIEDWKADEVVNKAVARYLEFQLTDSLRYLRSVKGTVQKMTSYFDNVDFSKVDKFGRPVYSIEKVTKAVKDAPGLVASLEKIEEKVQREGAGEIKIHGKGQISAFED